MAVHDEPSTASAATHPPVTAVVPTHNRPELMRAAVQSILDQTYQGEIEIIVVFDACPPDLPAVTVPEGRSLRAVVNERVRGLAGARNTGIMAAAHELVAFLDDDDEWMPTKLARQVAALQADPAAILVGTAIEVDDGTKRFPRLIPVDQITHAALLRDRMVGLHSSSFLFRRAALIDMGMVDEQLPGAYAEDYDLLLRTVKRGGIVAVNEPLVLARWQGQSYFFGKWALYAEALAHLLSAHPEFAKDRRALARIQSQIAFAKAASDQPKQARSWAAKAMRNDPTKVRSYLALGVSSRLVKAQTIIKAAQRAGRGI